MLEVSAFEGVYWNSPNEGEFRKSHCKQKVGN
jgi:hypothetical protein